MIYVVFAGTDLVEPDPFFGFARWLLYSYLRNCNACLREVWPLYQRSDGVHSQWALSRLYYTEFSKERFAMTRRRGDDKAFTGSRGTHANFATQIRESVYISNDVHQQALFLPDWDQEYTQINGGEFKGSVKKYKAGNIEIFSEQMNCQVYQKGALPKRKIGFGLPIKIEGESFLCGEKTGPQSLLVFSGNAGFEFLSPRNFKFFGVEISLTQKMDPVLEVLVERMEAQFASRERSIHMNRAAAEFLGQSLASLLDCQAVLGEEQELALNRQIVGATIDCLSENDPQSPPVRKNWHIVAAMRELVSDNPCCPRTVAEVVVELGVPRRTLQNACREVIGVSPLQYLRALRLSDVRRAIATAPSVTDAATQFGFWHLGYFSRDYKEMFGETPSQTLQRYRKR